MAIKNSFSFIEITANAIARAIIFLKRMSLASDLLIAFDSLLRHWSVNFGNPKLKLPLKSQHEGGAVIQHKRNALCPVSSKSGPK